MKPLKKYMNDGGVEPLTNRQFRRNERARSRAERDARIVERGADDVEGLMENLDDYYNLKDRDVAGKALGIMGTIGGLAKLAYMLEQRRRQVLEIACASIIVLTRPTITSRRRLIQVSQDNANG